MSEGMGRVDGCVPRRVCDSTGGRADGGVHGPQEPRSLLSAPRIVPLDASTLSVTISLEPILTPTTYALENEGNIEVDEEGREVAIRKIKLVSRGRKRERVRVCAWDLDGWRV